MKELVYFALNLAYDVGRILKREFYNSQYSISFKKDNSIVTEVDVMVEKYIEKRIKENYPNHSIYGEEGLKEKGEEVWYIDPIDGTTNFSKHIPLFTTSIGFESKELSFGVVYSPIIDEMYYSDGTNSYLNGEKIFNKIEKKGLKDAYLTMCHGRDRESVENASKILSYFKVNSKDIRKLGSTSLEMCFVGSSRVDALIAHNINLWDFKAAYYIAKGANLYVSEENIKGKNILLCSKKELEKDIKNSLNSIL